MKNSPQSVNRVPSAIILFPLFQTQTVWVNCLLSLPLLLPFLVLTSQLAELVLYDCFQGSQIPSSLNSGSIFMTIILNYLSDKLLISVSFSSFSEVYFVWSIRLFLLISSKSLCLFLCIRWISCVS